MSEENPEDQPVLAVNWEKISTRAQVVYYLLGILFLISALVFGSGGLPLL